METDPHPLNVTVQLGDLLWTRSAELDWSIETRWTLCNKNFTRTLLRQQMKKAEMLQTIETAEGCSKQIWHMCKSTTTEIALSLTASDFAHWPMSPSLIKGMWAKTQAPLFCRTECLLVPHFSKCESLLCLLCCPVPLLGSPVALQRWQGQKPKFASPLDSCFVIYF